MSDFEALYNDLILSFENNQDEDSSFLELLKNPDFVLLLKSLYEETDSADLYLKALSKKIRMCDLQRALCLLKKDEYDLPVIISYSSDGLPSEVEELETSKIENQVEQNFYFDINAYFEGDIELGDKNSLVAKSNYYDVSSIVKRGLERLRWSVADDYICPASLQDELFTDIREKSFIDSNEYVSRFVDNEIVLYCKDAEQLACLYYYLRKNTSNLSFQILSENCFIQIREYISKFNPFFKNILIEKITNNASIIEKCNLGNIRRIGDFLENVPKHCTFEELSELFDRIKKIDLVMPRKVFDKWIGALAPREYYVIKQRYFNDTVQTLEQVGSKCHVTRERIRQIEMRALRALSRSSKNNTYRSELVAKLKLLSQHKSFITINELKELEFEKYIANFLDKVTGDFIFDSDYDICFFSSSSRQVFYKNISELPTEFTKEDLEEYSVLISDETRGLFSPEEIFDLIIRNFKVYGEYITKSKITTKIVLARLMIKYSPNGLDIYDDDKIQLLREKAIEDFDGFVLAENNRAVRARLQAICVLIDRGVWKYDLSGLKINSSLKAKIIQYLEEYNSPVVPIQAIVDNFYSDLEEIDITNKYSLHGQLKKILPIDYSTNRDYVFKNDVSSSFYNVVEMFIKQAKQPVTKRDIQNNFPGITDIVIQQVAAATKVVNMNGYFVHLDNLNITDDESFALKEYTDIELSDGNIYHANTIFDRVKGELSGLFYRIGISHYLQFFYILRELYPSSYEYNRPFIAKKGVKIISGEAQVINLMLNSEECSIDQIREYAKTVGTVIDRYIEFIDRNNDSFIFKNRNTVIACESAGLNDRDFSSLDDILSEFMGKNDYRLLSEFYNFRDLPELNCPWNNWVLYSVVKKYSIDFKVAVTSNYIAEAKPVLVRVDYDVDDIDFSELSELDLGDTAQISYDDLVNDLDYEDIDYDEF